MKQIFSVFSFIVITLQVFSQGLKIPEDDIILIMTYTLPDRTLNDTLFKNYEVDSLLNYYVDKGIRPNAMIKSHRILQHYLGADSRRVIFFMQINKFTNINKSEEKTMELIDASFSDINEKALFWKRWFYLFYNHEDNLMLDWVRPK